MSETISFILFSAIFIFILNVVLFFTLIRKTEQRDDDELALDIYRQQFNEVSRDVERGVLLASDEEHSKLEIKKRLLHSNSKSQEVFSSTSNGINLSVTIFFVGFFIISSYLLYSALGTFGKADQPLEHRLSAINEFKKNRPSQKVIEQKIAKTMITPNYDQSYLNLIQKLREAVKKNNYDVAGLKLLVKYEISTNQYIEAHMTQKRLIEKLGKDVTSNNYTNYAQILINAANGYVSPEAEDSLKKALTLDNKNRRARYFTGLLMVQTKRPDLALNIWRELLKNRYDNDQWALKIRKRISQVEVQAGLWNE